MCVVLKTANVIYIYIYIYITFDTEDLVLKQIVHIITTVV